MFSDMPLNELESQGGRRVEREISFLRYFRRSKRRNISGRNAQIRKSRCTGAGYASRCSVRINGLTKSPLVLMDGKVKPFITWHHAQGARMADISCLLRHYPFVSSFSARWKMLSAPADMDLKSTTNTRRMRRHCGTTRSCRSRLESAQRFVGLEPLINDRFLIVSANYRQWVSKHSDEQSELSSELSKCITN